MKYSTEKIKQCADFIRENGLMEYGGCTLKEYCKTMGIDQETHYHWLAKSDYSEAIKEAKEQFKAGLEDRLVQSLAKSAEGYEWEETTTEFKPDKEGKPEVKGMRKVNRHVAANIGAAIFLLTNLNGEKWKNKQNVEGNVSVNAFEELMKSLPDEE